MVSKPSVVVTQLTTEYPKVKKRRKRKKKGKEKVCGTFFDVKIRIMMGETNKKRELGL